MDAFVKTRTHFLSRDEVVHEDEDEPHSAIPGHNPVVDDAVLRQNLASGVTRSDQTEPLRSC